MAQNGQKLILHIGRRGGQLLVALLVFDIRDRAEPPKDGSVHSSLRNRTHDVPALRPIGLSQTGLELQRAPRARTAGPRGQAPLHLLLLHVDRCRLPTGVPCCAGDVFGPVAGEVVNRAVRAG